MSEHLYIHVPFCRKKCRYCDFYSQTDLSLVPAYVSGLIREIRLRSASAASRPARGGVSTVYFGGGTPSVLPLEAVDRITGALNRYYGISAGAEITLEANPGTLDSGYLKGVRALGVNRLSLGVQSFDDGKLGFLGRIHTGRQAVRAFEAARSAGFDNIGLDLIYGVPGESRDGWQRDMDSATELGPEHLSCYMLTLEPGTPLYAGYEQDRFKPMAPSGQTALFILTSGYLEKAGYVHYEISNLARGAAYRSRHNSAYWHRVPYTGFGPSAHSFRTEGETGPVREVRSWNLSDLSAYTDALAGGRLPEGDSETISAEQQLLEWVMVGLRTRKGLDVEAFDRVSTRPFKIMYKDLIARLGDEKFGCMTDQDRRFALTLDGWARLDSIVEAFASGLDDG